MSAQEVFSRFGAGSMGRGRHAPVLPILIGVIVAILVAMGAARGASPTAAEFVQQKVNEGVAILGDGALAQADRRAKFRDYVLGLVDERRIALFTLGRYRRGADEAVIEQFVAAFTDYAVAVYEARLGEYSDQSLKVTDTLERSPTDIVVTTVLEGNGANAGEPVNVSFRLSKDGDVFTVVDIQVVGIWLAIDQQSQFGSFLSQNGGDIAKLSADLSRRAADIRAGKATE